jgi:hypothetical protein
MHGMKNLKNESNTFFEMPGSSAWHNKPEYTGLPDNFHFGILWYYKKKARPLNPS